LSNTAYIRDIASLEQLRIAIARFCEESENQLLAIDSKLQSRIGNLKSLESQFQRMIESAQDEVLTVLYHLANLTLMKTKMEIQTIPIVIQNKKM